MKMNGKSPKNNLSFNNQQQQPQYNQQQQTEEAQKLIQTVQSLETNNKSLAEQCERYRRELARLKHTMINCNETMKQQQSHILKLNGKISGLRKTIGLRGSSSEELLTKQIRLLKSQRTILIQELKDLREQNEKLKNMIVTGQAPKQYAR